MNILEKLITASAVTMTEPALYGSFHIICAALGILFAVLGALYFKNISEKKLIRILFICGVILCLSEVYKQFFLYYAVNSRAYLWERFPFQLCSVPMYIMVLLPFMHSTIKKSFISFLPAFALLGGIIVYLDPSDMLSSYVFLTFHSFIWHFILIFCGIVTALNYPRQKFIYPLSTYLICCVIAVIINITFNSRGYIAMFYINPYRPMTQIVFRDISAALGPWPGIFIYVFATSLGGYGFYRLVYIIKDKIKEPYH